jgi:hypothetical protein
MTPFLRIHKYRLERTYAKAKSFKEADNNRSFWLQKDAKERLQAAWYLISYAYGFYLANSPRLDKTVFSMRGHQR